MNSSTFSGFVDELVKIADIHIGDESHPIGSAGLFIGTETDHTKKAAILSKLLKKHKSLNKSRAAYEKLYPDDFVTGARHFDKSHSGAPKLHFHVGRSGGEDQRNFYNSVFAKVGHI